MTNKLKLNGLLTLTLLSGLSGAVAANAKESGTLAPEATAAEAEMSFRDIPPLDAAFIDTSPADRNDGITVGALKLQGGKGDMIVKLAEEIAAGQHDAIDSLLIAHKGELLFESYYARGRVDLPHPQASARKTYTAMALGRAIQLGHLTMADLDKPVISFFDDLDESKFAEGAELVTLKHALTMTTGIRISEQQWEEFRQNPEMMRGRNEVQSILEHSLPITEESQTFVYGIGPDLVLQVIDASVPGSASDFIEEELLSKMGFSNYSWRIDSSGRRETGLPTSMTSRDMMKWGMLIATKGEWNGEQLLPQAFIEQATSKVIDTSAESVFGGGPDVSDQGYGYFMWNADLKSGDKSYYSTSAQGGGGQFIILVDELDLLVVATASERHPSTLQLTAERILPAFSQ
jgi:CubicO group peptidase (beta-lactamase class C family)